MELNWPIGISTGIFVNSPIANILEPLKKAGFDTIEIAAFPHHFNYHSPQEIAFVKHKLDQLGLKAFSLHAPYSAELDITSPVESQRQRAVNELASAAAAIPQLGGHTLVLHAGSEDERAADSPGRRLKQSIKSLKEIYAFCQENNLKMAIEDMLSHLLGGRTWELKWILGELQAYGIGVCLDTGHSFLSGDLFGRLKTFAPYLTMLHIHDNQGKHDDHLPPGEGNIEWPALFRSLSEIRFKGNMVLEISGGNDPLQLLERAKKSVAFLKNLTERSLPVQQPAADQRHPADGDEDNAA